MPKSLSLDSKPEEAGRQLPSPQPMASQVAPQIVTVPPFVEGLQPANHHIKREFPPPTRESTSVWTSPGFSMVQADVAP